MSGGKDFVEDFNFVFFIIGVICVSVDRISGCE